MKLRTRKEDTGSPDVPDPKPEMSMSERKQLEQEMHAAIARTLGMAKSIQGKSKSDIRYGHPYNVFDHNDKETGVAYSDDDTQDTRYVRRANNGESLKAWTSKARGGRRSGQFVRVETEYEARGRPKLDRGRGSETWVGTYDAEGNPIRERTHKSDGPGLSPLVTKIVTQGFDKQVENEIDRNENRGEHIAKDSRDDLQGSGLGTKDDLR